METANLETRRMSIVVEVGLPSGKTATVTAQLDEEVGTLQRRAQTTLGVGPGRLLDSSGSTLNVFEPISGARVQNGDSLILYINRLQFK